MSPANITSNATPDNEKTSSDNEKATENNSDITENGSEGVLSDLELKLEDTGGDAIIDQFGVTAWKAAELVQYIMRSNGVNAIDIDANNRIIFNYATTQGLRGLNFVNDLANYYKVVKFDQGPSSAGTPNMTYENGKAAIYVNAYNYNENILKKGLLFSLVAPLPMGPDVNKYPNSALVNMWCILSTCEIPREVAQIMYDVCIIWDENLQPNTQFQEVLSKLPYDWEWTTTGRRISTERAYKLSIQQLWSNFTPDFTNGVSEIAGVVTSKISTPIVNATATVSQAVEAARQAIEAVIDGYK